MCKYCNMEDIPEDILEKEFSLFSSKIRFEVYLNGNSLRLCIANDYKNPMAKRRVNYCPMRGRKLNTD